MHLVAGYPRVGGDVGDEIVAGKELRPKLLVLAEIDRIDSVEQSDLLQHDGYLAAVGRSPDVKLNHV